MLAVEVLLGLALFYLLLLFAIAYWGDKSSYWQNPKPIIYSLGLGVYCTSWTFFGITGQAAETGWWFAPTFAGAIAVYVLAWPLVLRVSRICKQYQITSLADFIATRYGRSGKLAGLIALVSVFAIVPYMSLQIRAITNSFEALIESQSSSLFSDNSTLFFTLLLAVFAILFGTRRVRSSEHNPGLMFAIAFESIVKLVTALIVGIFVCYVMFDGLDDLFSQAQQQQLSAQFKQNPSYIYVSQALIGALMMFCLPRQFHMCFIENNNTRELRYSRWIFPLYMIGINLFALPIAYAGLLLFEGKNVAVDSFMLQLPVLAESPTVSAITFLGGFSAASSMVIVASIVLAIMVSNDLVTPWIVKREFNRLQKQKLSPQRLLIVRRVVIFVTLMFAYLYHRVTQDFGLLANTGLMAMSLLAQFSPALLLGLFWRKANQIGAYRGIIAGSLVWLYTLFIPTILLANDPASPFVTQGPLGISWLRPTQLFALDLELISHSLLLSLSTNLAIFIYFALTRTANISEQLQTSQYIPSETLTKSKSAQLSTLSVKDVADLMKRFIDQPQVEKMLAEHFHPEQINWTDTAPQALEELAERELSAIIGGASAKLIVDSAKRYQNNLLSDVVELVDEASEVLKFNRSLLQSTIQNIDQGISVVDKELKLVAWNRRYLEMFAYPEEEIYIGRPVEEVLRFNIKRGLIKNATEQETISKRLGHLRSGKPYRFQRVHANGTVFEMKGNPLPGGGFVTTYTDITEFVETQRALQEINAHLESRVKQRTEDLQAMNVRLEDARQVAEQANHDKTRYFAAVSHDLLQPFNAATLFSSILMEKSQDPEINQLSTHIHNALENADQLLASILELTKLDAGVVSPQIEDFCLEEVLKPVAEEFEVIARNKGLSFSYQFDSAGTRSDKKLLRRILQNFLTNAIRYTAQGGITLRVDCTDQLIVNVIDTGPGIKPEDQQRIFNDFEQLEQNSSEQGLGLGLAIASKMARLLGHELSLESTPQQGSQFSISLPIVNLTQQHLTKPMSQSVNPKDLNDLQVMVIDNDKDMLSAMTQRLIEWGCQVYPATNYNQAREIALNQKVQLIIADYHLDNNETGLVLIQQLAQLDGIAIPAIINSADQSMEVREMVTDAGVAFLHKPVKPAALKRQIKRLVKVS